MNSTLNRFIVLLIVLLFPMSVFSYELDQTIYCDDLKLQTKNLLHFIEDQTDYLDSNMAHVSGHHPFFLPKPSAKDKAEYLRVLASKAVYSFIRLRLDPAT